MSIGQIPNTALISSWSDPKETRVTIIWSTDSTAKGRVDLITATNGAVSESTFDGGGSPGVRSGQKDLTVRLGTSYLLILKDANTDVQIDSLQVAIEEVTDLPRSFKEKFQGQIPLIQAIYDVHVEPGVDSVRIRFQSRQPTLPVVTVINANGEIVAGAYPLLASQKSTVFDFQFGRPPSLFDPFEQNTMHEVRILAPWYSGNHAPIETRRQFVTGHRRATAAFGWITVSNDGDNQLFDGAGDFEFRLGAGGINGPGYAQSATIGDPNPIQIDSGGSTNLGVTVTIPEVAPRIYAQVLSRERDGGFVAVEDIGFREQGVEAWGEFTRVTQHFDFSWLTNGRATAPIRLWTGDVNVDFTLTGQIDVVAVPGTNVRVEPDVRRQLGSRIRFRSMNSATALRLGARVTFRPPRRKRETVLFAPDGGLHYLSHPGAGAARWTDLRLMSDTPVTVVSGLNGLHLLRIGPEGQLQFVSALHRNNLRWNTVHSERLTAIGATSLDDDTLQVFAIDSGGRLWRTRVGEEVRAHWERVGDGFDPDTLFVLAADRGEPFLVARRRDGHLMYRVWPTTRPVDAEWQSIDDTPEGLLAADVVDSNTLVLCVLNEAEQVWVLARQRDVGAPQTTPWVLIGNLESLLEGWAIREQAVAL